jgi:hypothetical protein
VDADRRGIVTRQQDIRPTSHRHHVRRILDATLVSIRLLARKMHETTWSAGIEMPILTVRHVTAYYYKTPVAFGEHRMILRPRDDDDQQVLETQARNHTRAQPTDLDAGHVWQSRGARSSRATATRHLDTVGLLAMSNGQAPRWRGVRRLRRCFARMQWLKSGGW